MSVLFESYFAVIFIQSFAKLFGEEFLEYLPPTDVEDRKLDWFEKEETRDPSAVLQEAKGALLVVMSTK